MRSLIMLFRNYMYAFIIMSIRTNNAKGTVRARIIHNNNLYILIRLSHKTVQALLHIGSTIIGRHN